MSSRDFRRIALALERVVENAHMARSDCRANNRIFATLHHDLRFGMVRLTPQQQREFIRENPGLSAAEPGAWGRAGSTGAH